MPRVTASARHQTKGTTLKSGQPCFPRLNAPQVAELQRRLLAVCPERGVVPWSPFTLVFQCKALPPVPRGFRFSFRAGPLPASHAPRYVSLGTNVCVRFLRVPERLTFALRFPRCDVKGGADLRRLLRAGALEKSWLVSATPNSS